MWEHIWQLGRDAPTWWGPTLFAGGTAAIAWLIRDRRR